MINILTHYITVNQIVLSYAMYKVNREYINITNVHTN